MCVILLGCVRREQLKKLLPRRGYTSLLPMLQGDESRGRHDERIRLGLGQIWVSGFGPSEPAAASAAPYASSGPHPSPAASPAIVEEPRARTVRLFSMFCCCELS